MALFKKIARKIKSKFTHREILPILVPKYETELLNNKIVMITGGNGGIGFAIAKGAIKAGAKVIICGTNTAKTENACKELGENAKGLYLNLAEHNAIEKQVLEGFSLFPENRIDILVNSAGLHGDWDFFNFDWDSFDKVLSVNVQGTYYVSQIIAKQMIEKKIKGHILNISSSSALRPAWTPYQISKWAVNGITKGLADFLLPYGITVNAIAPGPCATEMVGKKDAKDIYYENQPAHRYLVPEEVANLAIFMMSDNGNMIVGDTYYISGGSGVISYHK